MFESESFSGKELAWNGVSRRPMQGEWARATSLNDTHPWTTATHDNGFCVSTPLSA